MEEESNPMGECPPRKRIRILDPVRGEEKLVKELNMKAK
jgi:hypothetical protein